MKPSICVLLISFLVISCANSNIKPIVLPADQVIVEKTVYVGPPERLTQPCGPTESDGSIMSEITRLNDLVKCERRDKKAIRIWRDKLITDDPL